VITLIAVAWALAIGMEWVSEYDKAHGVKQEQKKDDDGISLYWWLIMSHQ
jgi:hypothetical protein